VVAAPPKIFVLSFVNINKSKVATIFHFTSGYTRLPVGYLRLWLNALHQPGESLRTEYQVAQPIGWIFALRGEDKTTACPIPFAKKISIFKIQNH
jgi:hypothetical protein